MTCRVNLNSPLIGAGGKRHIPESRAMAVEVSKDSKGRSGRAVGRRIGPVGGEIHRFPSKGAQHLGERNRAACIVLATPVVLGDRKSRAGVLLRGHLLQSRN